MQYQSYGTVQKETSGGRSLEREVLERVTIRLKDASRDPGPGEARLQEALRDNRSLWLTFASDLANPANTCPAQVKASLISIAAFVERNTLKALRSEEVLSAFIEINTNILDGLRNSPQTAAA